MAQKTEKHCKRKSIQEYEFHSDTFVIHLDQVLSGDNTDNVLNKTKLPHRGMDRVLCSITLKRGSGGRKAQEEKGVSTPRRLVT